MTTNNYRVPIQGTKYTSVVIPFRSMPNACKILDTEDYLTALSYCKGPLLGFMIVIHMNTKYPEWHNMRYSETGEDNVSIFTGNGWEPCLISNIIDQLNREMDECVSYFKTHQNDFFKNVHIF